MADYCTSADVLPHLPQGSDITDETYPKSDVIDSWVTQTSNRVNVAFKKASITLPITDTDQLGELKMITSQYVAWMILMRRERQYDRDHVPYWLDWETQFNDLIEKIESNGWVIPSTSASLPSSRTMNAEGDETTPGIQPTFTTTREY